LNFREQVELFSQAAFIAGAHGAGHANVLFAPPGCKVLDLFEPVYVNSCYWTMSLASQHDYWYMFGETVPSTEWNPDMHIPVEKLDRVLKAMTTSVSHAAPIGHDSRK
jgi:capsular polysaccharide biosynthesis protein